MKKQLLFSFVALLCFGFANAQMVQTSHGTDTQCLTPDSSIITPIQLPYFNDFEDSLTYSDFHFLNGTQTNQWVISNAPEVNNTENGNAVSWYVEYKKTTEENWTQLSASINPYIVENLDPSTSYQFRVQSFCGSEASLYSVPVSMTTLCDTISHTDLPWENGFESITVANTLPDCWAATNFGLCVGTQIEDHSYYNRRARNGTRSAYFIQNCNDYLFTPKFELQGGVSYNFSFWYITDGFDGWQSLQAGVYSDQKPDSLIQQLAEVTNINNTTYQRLKGTFTPTIDGIYCFGVYCHSINYPLYLTMDDFKVSESSACAEPVSLTVTNITSSSAEINFIPAQVEDTIFKLYWKISGDSIWEEVLLNGTTSFELTDLLYDTTYQVRVYTDCMDGTYSDYIDEVFSTLCTQIEDLPYIESFDTCAEGTFPDCWNYLATTFSWLPYCSSLYSISPPNSLYLGYYFFVCGNNILVAPKIHDSFELSELQVSFYIRSTDSIYVHNVHFGVMEDPTVPSSFTPMQTFAITDEFQQYTAYLYDYTGTAKYLAFQFEYYPMIDFYFDDFVVDYLPECQPITDLTVTNIGAASAMVSWTPHGTPDSYTVELVPIGSHLGVQYNTTNNYYVLTGLTEITDYIVKVTPICSGDEGVSLSTTFATICPSGGEMLIGTPEATTSTYGGVLPISPSLSYSYTQQIFDAVELSSLNDMIYGIGFQYFFGTNLTKDVEIYLGHTAQTNFSSPSDYVPDTHFVKVFDGIVVYTNTEENNWVTIDFTTPFAYNPDSNLVVTVVDREGMYTYSSSSSDPKFRTHATNDNKTIYYHRNTSPYSLTPSGGTAEAVAYRNNVKFLTSCDELSCYSSDLIVAPIEANSVVYRIIPVASETSWEVEYKRSEATTWISLGTVNTTTNTIFNLVSNTQYDLRVRSVCGSIDVSTWREVSFTTKVATPASIPYFCDFEDPVENLSWDFKNSAQVNKWYIGDASNNSNVNNTLGGANALYISNDGGDSWAYTAGTGNNSISYAFRDFAIPQGVTELRLTIDWIANGAGEADMLSLYWVSPDADIHAGMMPSGTLSEDSALVTTYGAQVNDTRLYGVTDWQESTTFSIKNTQFPNFAGKTWRLYFLWRNDVSSVIGQQPPAVVDNITLEAVSCSSPSQMHATTATQTSVTLNWAETGNATSWNVEYRKSIESTWNIVQTSSKPFVVNGLDHSSTYVFRVQANCGDESSGYSTTVIKNTLCSPVTDLPWEDGFESITTAGAFPPCWLATGNTATLTTQIANCGSSNRRARTGTRSAYFTSGANNRLYTPGIQLQGGVSYNFSFWYVTDGHMGWNTLQSGVYSSQSSTTPIQVIATMSYLTNINYAMMSGTFVPAADGVYYFGVYCQLGFTEYLSVDDFVVYGNFGCVSPSGLEVSNVTHHTVDLEWIEEGDATAWEIEYGPSGFTTGTIVQASTNSFTLTGLNYSTAYQARVRSVCNNDSNSVWSPRVNFTTSCLPFGLPYLEDFSISPFQCWTQTFSGEISSQRWFYSNSTHAGGTAGEMKAVWIHGVGVTRLISPLIQFENVAEAELSFKHRYDNYGSGVSIKIQCSPDLQTWTDLPFSHAGSSIPATTQTLQFAPLADLLHFAWVIDGNHFDMNTWYVDDVSITATQVCAPPTDLQVNNITDQSAVATWTAGGSEASWQVDYKLVSAANWTTGIATTTLYTMTGLQSNAQYHVRVKAICTVGESSFTEPAIFTTAGSTTYTITASAGPNGTITPSGAVTVNQGESQIFTFTPEEGYRIDVVLVDDVPQIPVPESYMFEDIQADHTIHVDFAEGVNENELSKHVALYPNPTQYLIDLKIDKDYLGATECRIYNMYGKLLRVFPVEDEITTIDVSSFAAGIYFVRLTTEQGQVSKRFVKQ